MPGQRCPAVLSPGRDEVAANGYEGFVFDGAQLGEADLVSS